MAQYDLIFEGGGAKGIVFVGALEEFEAREHKARRFMGTSAGAITAALMAAGYTPPEMLAAMEETGKDGKPRFTTFMDVPKEFREEVVARSLTYEIFHRVDLPGVPEWIEKRIDRFVFNRLMRLPAYRQLVSFVEKGGLFGGQAFLEWIREKLDAKREGWGAADFARFSEETGSDLSVVVTDTTAAEIRILNRRTTPQCPVAWAVRMSMSIPFIWQEVRWKSEWGTYQGREIADHTIVDGGVLSNFPIRYFTSRDPGVVKVMGDTDPDAVPNLGLLIDEGKPVANSGYARDPEDVDGLREGILEFLEGLKTVGRLRRLVDSMTNARDNQAIQEHKKEICRLPAKGYGTTEFDMSKERRNAMVEAGRKAMKEYFDRQKQNQPSGSPQPQKISVSVETGEKQ